MSLNFSDTSVIHPGIFNDVLGPVAPGPSSSNTCGVCRIAKTAAALFGKIPGSAKVEMSTCGAFQSTFYGMGSELALLAGLLGRDTAEFPLSQAKADAQKAGLALDVVFTDALPGIPFELMRLTLYDGARTMCFTAASTGGGGFRFIQIDGCPSNLCGRYFALLLFLKPGTEPPLGMIEAALGTASQISFAEGSDRGLLEIQCVHPFPEALVKDLRDLPGAYTISMATPVYPTMSSDWRRQPVFMDYAGMRRYVKAKGIPLWQAALDYESSLTGLVPEAIWAQGREILRVSMEGVTRGFSHDMSFAGILPPISEELREGFCRLPLGLLSHAVPAALAVMEHGGAHGLIACMPTGGSAGVIPGVLYAAQVAGYEEKALLEALLTAGLVGSFLYETHYSGSIGCQAEIGCACAMAAAAWAHLLGGDSDVACNGAALALQCQLGLICDPVAGLVQVPCFVRNMAAVSTALTAAAASLSGFPSIIPFDEMVTALLQTGERVRCNNDCGACATPTARRLETLDGLLHDARMEGGYADAPI